MMVIVIVSLQALVNKADVHIYNELFKGNEDNNFKFKSLRIIIIISITSAAIWFHSSGRET